MFPPDAVKEIYGGEHTNKADIDQAVEIARGEDTNGLFVGKVTSDGFRIQKTGGVHY